MSNHIHCILSSSYGILSDTIRDFKSHTTKQILVSIQEEPESRREWMLFQFKHTAQQHVRNSNYHLWTHANHAVGIDLYISDMYTSKMIYNDQNAVKVGLVAYAVDYLFSIAIGYAG